MMDIELHINNDDSAVDREKFEELPSQSSIEMYDCQNEDLKIEATKIAVTVSKCKEAAAYERKYQTDIKDSIFNCSIPGTPHLLVGEKQLLALATYARCTDGILYAMPLIFNIDNQNILYLRCFETGIYKGFFQSNWRSLFKELTSNLTILQCHIVHIFNDWDVIAAQNHRVSSKKGHATEKNSKVFRKLTTTNKGSINNAFPVAYALFKKKFGTFAPGYMVFCQRMARHAKGNSNDNRYFKFEGLGDESQWVTTLNNFALDYSLIEHIDIPCVEKVFGDEGGLSLSNQFKILSACPNFHHWASKYNSGIKMQNYFIPLGRSPRNLIIDELEMERLDVIAEIVLLVLQDKYHVDQTPKKYRMVHGTSQRKVIDRETLLNEFGLSEEDFNFRTYLVSTIYDEFKRNLFNDGTIVWRENEISKQLVVMNDYSSQTGTFKFNDYVVVTRTISDGLVDISCNCEIFKVISAAASVPEWDGIKCCHVRALSEILTKFPIDFQQSQDHGYIVPCAFTEADSVVSSKINAGLKAVTCDVLHLSSTTNVEKFSVRSTSGHQFVHLFKGNKNDIVYVKCCSGICSTAHRKKINLRTLEEASLCPHLMVFKSYIDNNWHKHDLLSPDKLNDDIEENVNNMASDDDVTGGHDSDGDDYHNDVDDIPYDDFQDEHIKVDGFDASKSNWSFFSRFSREVCQDPFDEKLKSNTVKHLRYSLEALQNEEFSLSFYPPCDSTLCECKLQWEKDNQGDLVYSRDGSTRLFTSTTSISCEVYKIVCPSNNCVLRWKGAQENIYRLSSQICAVEELCWEFIELVSSMKCNFSAFCQFVGNNYARNGSGKSFMTSKTFSKLFFSWASHHPREFRKSCRWCGNSPKVLACDATKIGILHYNMDIDPIEKFENGIEVQSTESRRFDRCFIRNPTKLPNENNYQLKERERITRDSRRFLKSMTSSTPDNSISALEHENQKKKVIEVFPDQCRSSCQRFFAQDMNTLQLSATRKVLHLLSFDAPLRSFIPSGLFPYVYDVTNDPNAETLAAVLYQCQKYNPALGSLIESFISNNNLHNDIVIFLRYLCEQISVKESSIIEAPSPTEYQGSYNPPKYGRFYYFNPSGLQVRKVRPFSIDHRNEKSSSEIHDDQPSTSDCTKRYPTVSKSGASFLFLWFCPSHGHCYGGHIVNGSEGRKDPACSLFSHLDVAPEILFYDFACSLEEYCLNREADYFKNTRFYHDIFHGYSHNCSPIYSSKNLAGMDSYNTSICEQFNSYLQCIKASAKHMSQEHFIFYVQFMIDIWNRKKETNFMGKLKIALAGFQ